MLKIAHYAYLQTLVAIFSKRLLSEQQFTSLIEQPLDEILAELSNNGLQAIIKEIYQFHLKPLPAGNMDNLFLTVLLDDAQSIIRALSGAERDFFTYWIRRFELQNIKTILRGKSLQRSKELIRAELTPLNPFSILPIDKLLNADSLTDILMQLEKTPFASIARYGSKNFEQKRDVFTIETAINHQYFTGLNEQLKNLSNEEQILLQPLLGRIIDQTNLIWLLRYRLSYNLSPSHSYFLLVSGGLYLNSRILVQLCQIKSLPQIYDFLPNEVNKLIKGSNTIHQIELCLEKDTIKLARSFIKDKSFSLTHAFAYLLLREKQLSQLHALFKGKLLDLSDTEIAFAVGEDK
ncbi:MAG: V-type ATPase subunit [gamma proteobacterium symbiont of Taylorina sp.]|nr:V-type ATPase subunit [gamma proteobacterium symbiont of Taylorina sp.]